MSGLLWLFLGSVLLRMSRRREVMRILLAIDGSEQSGAAVDEVARRHFPADSEVRIIAVVEPPYLGEGMDISFYGVEVEQNARKQARAAIEKAVATLRADEESLQLNITVEVLSGSPKRMILEEAESFDADLIVVGSHGHGMIDRVLLGWLYMPGGRSRLCAARKPRLAKVSSVPSSLHRTAGSRQ